MLSFVEERRAMPAYTYLRVLKIPKQEEPQMAENFVTSFLASFQVMLMVLVKIHSLKTTAPEVYGLSICVPSRFLS